ncbi:response regulator [Candidatus Obscuribacterales bacterium]|nr:response regulator [Candidatus Obscuribacterales bacterium]MBX3149469.1 response regulator [Candidatus Obscuribacterales bacterium]
MTNENKTLFQEFKAPLIAIVSMTDVLKQTELSDEQRAFTRNIEESANSLLRLVNDVIENRIQDNTQLPPDSFAEVVNELRDLVANQSTAAPKSDSLKASDIRVLIVEDNPLLQLVIMKQLAHLGIRAEAVNDGEAACKAAKNFDLIFMDCRLPVLDGFEATMAIRKDEGDTETPKRIVALTAGYEDKTREKCLESGMDDCLIKPVGSQALRQVIERWFKLN